jgi:DNA-binding response OmpR family regulator
VPKILILEDDPTLLQLLQQFLGFEGYDVVALESFDNVIEDLQWHQPDGVILDIQLADKNGLDILDEKACNIHLCWPVRVWITPQKLCSGVQTTL